MKRVLTFLLALVMMFSLCSFLGANPALAADEAEEHEHEWAKATCTEPKTCTVCGATEGEAKGHKVEEWKTTVKATCTEEGEKTGVCTRCGETVTKTVKAKGHEPGEKWKTIQEPDILDQTLIRVKYCTRCGEECKRQEKELSDKEFKSWFKDHCKKISYKNLLRYSSENWDKRIKISGRVVEVVREGNGYGTGAYQYRVSTKSSGYGDVIWVNMYSKPSPKIIEGDRITIWGECHGTNTYYGTFGQKITIPEITARYFSIKD